MITTDSVVTAASARVTDSLEGLKSAMEALQTNVLVADPEFRIIYANPRAISTLRTLAGEIQKNFGVRVDDILGGSIHRFHKDPTRIERILHDPRSMPHEAAFTFGSVTLSTRINRIPGQGGTAGYIVAWDDVSEKMRMEAEAKAARVIADARRCHQPNDGAPRSRTPSGRASLVCSMRPLNLTWCGARSI